MIFLSLIFPFITIAQVLSLGNPSPNTVTADDIVNVLSSFTATCRHLEGNATRIDGDSVRTYKTKGYLFTVITGLKAAIDEANSLAPALEGTKPIKDEFSADRIDQACDGFAIEHGKLFETLRRKHEKQVQYSKSATKDVHDTLVNVQVVIDYVMNFLIEIVQPKQDKFSKVQKALDWVAARCIKQYEQSK